MGVYRQGPRMPAEIRPPRDKPHTCGVRARGRQVCGFGPTPSVGPRLAALKCSPASGCGAAGSGCPRGAGGAWGARGADAEGRLCVSLFSATAYGTSRPRGSSPPNEGLGESVVRKSLSCSGLCAQWGFGRPPSALLGAGRGRHGPRITVSPCEKGTYKKTGPFAGIFPPTPLTARRPPAILSWRRWPMSHWGEEKVNLGFLAVAHFRGGERFAASEVFMRPSSPARFSASRAA